MSTYLIFFGKSQDFVFHAFDEQRYIENFNDVIKDFDELESKVFTTDDVSNKQILSKYVFEKNGKSFSLLKLYSLAQAFQGSRIGGSIYGVGLLSDKDIKISDVNISILSSAKKSFTQLSLDGVKFKSSNFLGEVEKIWRALLNQNGINYFDKIEYNSFSKTSINNKVKAFCVQDLLKAPIELNNEIEQTSRLYFSDDFSHLKRTQVRWGKDTFPIYQYVNGKCTLYQEPQQTVKTNTPTSSNDITRLKLENGDLQRALETSTHEYEKNIQLISQKSQKTILILSTVSVLFFGLFLWKLFSKNEPVEKRVFIEVAQESIQIEDILRDSIQVGKLDTLITNIGVFKKERSQKYFDAIKRGVTSLRLDLTKLSLGDTTNLKKEELPPKKVETTPKKTQEKAK